MTAPVQPGDLLDGKYVVERVLGAGGMGVVVAAKHATLGQRVALKFMLKEAMADPGNVERFKREARAAYGLKSVHTTRVLDVGQLAGGEPYMVMEYLEGKDLDEVLRAGRLRPDVAIGYVLQACEALAEAHGIGLVHRDIKPKNLFLTTAVDGKPLVKVLDFGLAKNTGDGKDVSLTATTAVFGSPQYMSPEQMRSAKDADARSDIWSIGVCLYELLSGGRLPFDAPGVAEICAMVLKDPTPPLRPYAPEVPPPLEAIVMRCLAKDPNQRYQTVADLAVDLEPFTHFEGSSRRIIDVMKAASQSQPTILHLGGSVPPNDPIAKTISSWDSGDRTRPMTTASPKPPSPAVGILVGLAAAGVLMMAAAGVYFVKNKNAERERAAAAASQVLPVPEPMPVPEPVTVPTTPKATATAAAASSGAPAATAAADATANHAATPPNAAKPAVAPAAPTTTPKATTTTTHQAAPPPKPVVKPPTSGKNAHDHM